MSHEISDSSDPAAWLRYARGDLALARVPLPQDSFYELLCFHAQQAQEAVRLAQAVVQWAESILPAPDTESEDPDSESP